MVAVDDGHRKSRRVAGRKGGVDRRDCWNDEEEAYQILTKAPTSQRKQGPLRVLCRQGLYNL